MKCWTQHAAHLHDHGSVTLVGIEVLVSVALASFKLVGGNLSWRLVSSGKL